MMRRKRRTLKKRRMKKRKRISMTFHCLRTLLRSLWSFQITMSLLWYQPSASAPPTSSTLAQGSDLRTEDLQEEEEIMKVFENGCGCGNDCHKLFSESYIRTLRSDMLQMTRSEYIIMTQIKATTSMRDKQLATKEKHMKDKGTPTIICMNNRR